MLYNSSDLYQMGILHSSSCVPDRSNQVHDHHLHLHPQKQSTPGSWTTSTFSSEVQAMISSEKNHIEIMGNDKLCYSISLTDKPIDTRPYPLKDAKIFQHCDIKIIFVFHSLMSKYNILKNTWRQSAYKQCYFIILSVCIKHVLISLLLLEDLRQKTNNDHEELMKSYLNLFWNGNYKYIIFFYCLAFGFFEGE